MEFNKVPPEGRERLVSFHGGANTRLVPWLIGEHEVADVENMIINEPGVAERRDGCRAFGGIAALPGGIEGYNTATYDEFIVGAWGNALYDSDGDGGWARIATGTSLVPGLLHQIVKGRNLGQLALAVCTCEEVTDTAVGVGGRSKLVVYNIESDSATQVSLAPRCITAFQNRLFYAEREILGWSEIGQFASHSDTNQLLIEPGLGGQITALVATRDEDPKLLIFKQQAICLLTPRWGADGAFISGAADALDTVNSSIRIITRGTGCVATRSAVWVPGEQGADVFFLSADGVRSMQRAENDAQAGAGFPLTYNVKDWIDRINFAHAHKAAAAVYDNAYHLAVPMDGSKDNTHVLRYDIASKAWSLQSLQMRDIVNLQLGEEDRLFGQNRFSSGDTSTTEFVHGSGSTQPVQVYHIYGGTFDPVTNNSLPFVPVPRLITKSLQFEEPLVKKKWDRVTMLLASSDTSALEVAYSVDRGPWMTITEAHLDGSAGVVTLGTDPLPWQSSAVLARRKTFSMADAAPGYGIQFRVGGVTGYTDTGLLQAYMIQVQGNMVSDSFEND